MYSPLILIFALDCCLGCNTLLLSTELDLDCGCCCSCGFDDEEAAFVDGEDDKIAVAGGGFRT